MRRGRDVTSRTPGRRLVWLRRLLAAALVVGAVGVGVLVALYATTPVPLPGQLRSAQGTVVTMADGSQLGVIANEQDRTIIPLAQVPGVVRQAVLAAEDRHFYSEPAISVPGIARAALSDVIHRRIVAGGSTITQQYVKNAYLGSERTLSRKLREAMIAVKLERRDSKDQILGLYLNTIYFGRGAYGIEAASETYFGIPAARLDAAQGAVLAALIQAPELLDPSVDAAPAIARWHYVLTGMVKDHALTAQAAAALPYPAVRPRGAGAG